MSTPDPRGVVELSADQILTVRGAAAAIIDAIDSPYLEIDDQFDPVRRDHLEAASAELADALADLAPGGMWRGRLPPSEQQALRDAIGAVEAMVTPPVSARIQSLDYRATDDELDHLAAALEGVPPVDREDLAYSDFRFGGTDRVLDARTSYEELTSVVLNIVRGTVEPVADLDRVEDRTFPDSPGKCSDRDLALVEMTAHGARLASAGRRPRLDAAQGLSESVHRALTAGDDCYRDMDDWRIRVAAERIAEAVRRSADGDAQNYALGAAEMVAWAESNRLREEKIGLR